MSLFELCFLSANVLFVAFSISSTKLRPVKIEDENENDFEISEESQENISI
jgi:hypothetical protein